MTGTSSTSQARITPMPMDCLECRGAMTSPAAIPVSSGRMSTPFVELLIFTPVIRWRKSQPSKQRMTHCMRSFCNFLPFAPHLSGLWKSDSKLRRFWTIRSQLKLEDGVLYQVKRPHGLSTDKMLLVLPQSLVQESLTAIHDSLGHFGTDKTIAMAEERFWWPGYVSDIQTWVKTCATRAQSKPPHRNLRAPMEFTDPSWGTHGDDRD